MPDNMVFCSQCGSQNPAGGTFCQKCGAQLAVMGSPAPMAAPAPAYYPPQAAVSGTTTRFGGFWIRFLAIIIDGIIIRVAVSPIVAILGVMGVLPWLMRGRIDETDVPAIVGASVAIAPIFVIINWLYEAIMTSSTWQATVGKKILGLKVTDEAGNRISFARATGRHFAKIISVMTCFIGFIMAAFTDRKRALHDFIAGTLVIKS